MINVCRMCEEKVDIKRMVVGFVLERECAVCGRFRKTETAFIRQDEETPGTVAVGGCALVETH
jgi:hypothetical protein